MIHTGLTLSWQTVLVGTLTAGLAVGGLLLSQSAYAGDLAAPLAILTLANPLASAAIGLTLLGERIPGSLTGVAVAAAGAAVASRGIASLTRPVRPEDPDRADVRSPATAASTPTMS